MPEETIRVVLAQLEPRETVAENVELVAATIAAHPGSLVVFPELMLNGYDLREVRRHALAVDGRELVPVGAAAGAAGSRTIVGFAEAGPSGVANSAAVFDQRGTLVATYRKTHLFAGERRAFVAGDELRPVATGGVPVGLMLCFDMEFPEVARTLTLRSARLLVTISANMEPYGDDHDVIVRMRAIESRLRHVYVNRTGAQGGFDFVGGSQAVLLDGSVVARLGRRRRLPPWSCRSTRRCTKASTTSGSGGRSCTARDRRRSRLCGRPTRRSARRRAGRSPVLHRTASRRCSAPVRARAAAATPPDPRGRARGAPRRPRP